MRISIGKGDLRKLKADLAACFAYEGDARPRGITDPSLRKLLGARMRAERFGGRPGDVLTWNGTDGYAAGRYIVVGLGARSEANDDTLRVGCARAAREAELHGARSLALRLPGEDAERSEREVRVAAEGVILGSYRFDRYLTDPTRRPKRLTSTVIAADGRARALGAALRRGEAGARAVYLARDLVNEGPSRLTPVAMARQARALARRSGLRCRIYGPAELRKLGFNAMLAVARGSVEPPQLVHLSYRPANRGSRRKVLLVGKGVTFDSGGLDLKPADAMLTMKMDMAGAAAVLAAMTELSRFGCRAEVHAYLGLVENMTGGAAYKPGDILETWSGKTVEVGNTDAEGRLVLCDLLAHGVAKLRPTHVVDLATLTGACVVALGLRAAGLFTRHEAFGQELLVAARAAGEKLWPMPMYEEYLRALQKGPADLRNVAGRWGGAITAALFLGEFVPRQLPWVHLDIAGPAYTESDLPEAAAGGTGAGVLTLLHWLEGLR